MAESTPFWTEELNEILAGGHKLFSESSVSLAERFQDFDRRITELRSFL